MRQVLTNPEAGYYTTASSSGGSEVFGRKGDFVTSPEITQVFGELIGIWTVAEWIAQGRRSSGVELIEVGPGKVLTGLIKRIAPDAETIPADDPATHDRLLELAADAA